MSSAAMQARATALNAKMEGEAAAMLETIERSQLRKIARESFACAVRCYDKAGTSGPSDVLENCARNCQVPYQQATALVQNVRIPEIVATWYDVLLHGTYLTLARSTKQEVAQFQNRLNRNMQECQEKARDMLTPGAESDPNKMAKVENALISCMEKQVNEHIKLLRPMKDRIGAALKSL